MKLEKAFTVGEVIVKESFQKGDISVYADDRDSTEHILYFVNNKTGDVLFKQTITTDMAQGTGYISSIYFEGVK